MTAPDSIPVIDDQSKGFADDVLNGIHQTEAYMKHYPDATEASAVSGASRKLATKRVKAYIAWRKGDVAALDEELKTIGEATDRDEAIASYALIAKRAAKAGQHKIAMDAMKELNRLRGIKPATDSEHANDLIARIQAGRRYSIENYEKTLADDNPTAQEIE